MTTMPLAQVRAHLSRLVDDDVATHARIDITRNGRREAVLLSADDFDSIIETLEVMSDPELMAGIKEGLRDIAAGRTYPVEEVKADFQTRHKRSA